MLRIPKKNFKDYCLYYNLRNKGIKKNRKSVRNLQKSHYSTGIREVLMKQWQRWKIKESILKLPLIITQIQKTYFGRFSSRYNKTLNKGIPWPFQYVYGSGGNAFLSTDKKNFWDLKMSQWYLSTQYGSASPNTKV